MVHVIPEEENEFQVINDILINHSMLLEEEYYNLIAFNSDYNDCYFDAIAIMLRLETDDVKDLLNEFLLDKSNANTIDRLIIDHHSSRSAIYERLESEGNMSGFDYDLYNELILECFNVNVNTYYILQDYVRITTIKTCSPQVDNVVVINLLLVQDPIGHRATFFPLRNI